MPECHLGRLSDGSPEFGVSVDTAWDRMLAVADASSLELPENTALRTALPHLRPTLTVRDACDVTAVNAAIRLGGQVRIDLNARQLMNAPEIQELADYWKMFVAVREVLPETLLDGQWLGTQGLQVDGASTYSVFCRADQFPADRGVGKCDCRATSGSG